MCALKPRLEKFPSSNYAFQSARCFAFFVALWWKLPLGMGSIRRNLALEQERPKGYPRFGILRMG
jgi:hypothetical protein